MENTAQTIQAPYDVASVADPQTVPHPAESSQGDTGENPGRSALADPASLSGESGGSASPAETGEAAQKLAASEEKQAEEKAEANNNKSELLTKLEQTKTSEELANALKTVNVDYQALEQEFLVSGALSEASLASLEKAGIPRDYVARYLQGQQALLNETVDDITSLAGGREEYAKVTNWALSHLSKEEQAAFNQLLDSGNIPLIKMAVSGLVANYRQAEGVEPTIFKGKAGSAHTSSVGSFSSAQEMIEAMRDQRYGRDPAYTREVERKAAHSSFF